MPGVGWQTSVESEVTELDMINVAWMGVVTAGAIYAVGYIASKAFFRAKFEYHRKLAEALMKGDQEHDKA